MWCTRRVVGCFPFFFLTKNVRKCDENVHRVKKVITIYLTQVPFVPSLGQIQHGGELLWKVINGTHISPGKIPTGKTGLPFQIFTIHREFSEERLKNVCVSAPFTPNRNFLVKETGPLLLLNQCLSFKVQYCCFSIIQLVVYYQCCVLIVWATTRLYVIAHS